MVAQFIVTDGFQPVVVEGAFSKAELDQAYVATQEELMTRGWLRLQELYEISAVTPLADYPLPEFRLSK